MQIMSQVPPPEFHANVSLYQILFSLLISFVFGFAIQSVSTWVLLRVKYWNVSGSYTNYRDYGGARLEPTGGTIRVRLRFLRGYFSTSAFHASGELDWAGQMHLSLSQRDMGTGMYWDARGEGVGDQKFRFDRQRQELMVQGTRFTPGEGQSFFHRWKRN